MPARLAAALLAVAWALGGVATGAEPRTLRVCLLEDDPPRSERAGVRGFDVQVVQALAASLGRQFEPVWIASPPTMTEVEESDLPLADLARGRCDALLSVPGELALADRGDELVLLRPYYAAGFELVGPDTLPNEIEALVGRRIAVQSVSVAHLVLQSLGVEWTARRTPAEQLAALRAREADAALVWGPALALLDARPKHGFVPPESLRWNMHVAVRSADASLAVELDAALGRLLESGAITRLLESHGIPARAPFDRAFSRGTLRALLAGAPR